MSNNSPMTGDHRKVYGEALEFIMKASYGLGVQPHRIRMERAAKPTSARAQFDILLLADDKEYEILFENKTVEELKMIAEVIDLTKELVLNCHQKGDLVLEEERMFVNPNPEILRMAIAGSFTPEFAEMLIPKAGAANSNTRIPVQRAASQVKASTREKDPARVRAGRLASAKRYGAPPVLPSVPQSSNVPKV